MVSKTPLKIFTPNNGRKNGTFRRSRPTQFELSDIVIGAIEDVDPEYLLADELEVMAREVEIGVFVEVETKKITQKTRWW